MKERNLRHSVSEPVSASRSELCSFYPVQSQTHVGYMSYIIRISVGWNTNNRCEEI